MALCEEMSKAFDAEQDAVKARIKAILGNLKSTLRLLRGRGRADFQTFCIQASLRTCDRRVNFR